MAKSLNKALLFGNLGQDPEVKHTADGTAVCNLRIATNESYKDAAGEWQERTEWHNAVCFGRQAEVAGEYLRKGSSVLVEGKLQTRSYEKDGVTRYSTEVKVRDLILGGKGDGEGRPAVARPAPAPAPQAQPASAPAYDPVADDGLPF